MSTTGYIIYLMESLGTQIAINSNNPSPETLLSYIDTLLHICQQQQKQIESLSEEIEELTRQ